MNTKLVLVIVVIMAQVLLVSCGGKASYVGKYAKDSFFIELKSDGSFHANNFMKFEGTYKVNGNAVRFIIKSMNGESLENIAEGKLDGDKLTGPDGFEYTKAE
jgi:hypothetical protein